MEFDEIGEIEEIYMEGRIGERNKHEKLEAEGGGIAEERWK